MKPQDNPYYKKIYNLLDAVQIEVTNAVIDILAEKQNQVDKLTAELEQIPQVDPERYAKLENLLDLVAEDIEWQELHRADSPKFKPLITLYRELRPKEDSAK
jgi:hypothetical protein